MKWITENILSLYAAVVGTIALFLNFGRFWIMYRKSVRKLRVFSTIDNSAQEQLNLLAKPDAYEERTSNLVGPIYKITVLNNSHVDMHIDDVGIIIKGETKQEKIRAYV